MTTPVIGVPTYHTRVERWECDYNDHWNVKFYGRSFQAASEVIAAQVGENIGADTVESRLLRFHGELRVSAPVEVRSAALDRPEGGVIHEMWSAGKLAATALDMPGVSGTLPIVSPDDVPMGMPRSIVGPLPSVTPDEGADVTRIELGPVRSEDLDHMGKLRFDTLLRHSSNIQHIQLNNLGLTPEFADQHRVNRMGVEFRVTRGQNPREGDCLIGKTWIYRVSNKAFWANTTIETTSNDLVAFVEMCVVSVDLDTRRAVPVPQFIHDALGKVGR